MFFKKDRWIWIHCIISIIVIIIAIFVIADAAHASVETIPAEVNVDQANIRLGPSLTAPIVGVANKGDQLKFVFAIEENGWSELLYVDNQAAYIRSNFLTFTSFKEIPAYTSSQLQIFGVIYWGGWRWTWYSQNVLPGGGLNIPGRHVDKNNYICDEDDYICLASSALSLGTIVDTPFGKQGKVYDSGCPFDTLDVYTNF